MTPMPDHNYRPTPEGRCAVCGRPPVEHRRICGAVRVCSRPFGHRGPHGGFRPVTK